MAKIEVTDYAVTRAFNHRTYGAIGQVTLSGGIGDLELNGQTLPGRSVEYLLTFALQSLQDAYAGAANADEAKAAFDKKLNAIINGTIGIRTGGGNGKPAYWKFVRAIVRDALTKRKAEYEALDGAAEKNAFLDEAFAGLPDDVKAKIEAKANALFEAEQKRKAEAADVAKGIDL